MASKVTFRNQKAIHAHVIRIQTARFEPTQGRFLPAVTTVSNSASQPIHPSRQPETSTASNSAGQPTNEPLTPTTPTSLLRQQVTRLKEQLEEAEDTIKELRKELEGREEREEMRSVEGEGDSLI